MIALKKKLASYTALSTAFLASSAHDAESQITYIDLPDDPKICNSVMQINNNTGSDNDDRGIWVNILNGSVAYSNGSATAYAQPFVLFNIASVSFFRGNSTYTFYRSITGRIEGYGNFAKNLSNSILRLNSGDPISAGLNFGDGGVGFFSITQAIYSASSYNGYTSSDFERYFINNALPSTVSGYVGFRFDQGANNKYQYGWMRITVEFDGDISVPLGQNIISQSCITIHEYAYQNTPDTPITAGQVEVQRPIPTLGQWGFIILNMLLLIFGITALKQRMGAKQKASS